MGRLLWKAGWGIRRKETHDTLYYTEGEEDEPPSTGWRSFARYNREDEPPSALSIVCTVCDGVKRGRDAVCDVQERAWKQRKFSDAEIVCAGVRTAVHRSTLCAASPVFDAAFSST